MSSVYISAAHKSSGKTTLTIGLIRALADRDLVVQPYKKGPDYIDPLWLSSSARRPCYNLDFHTQTHQQIKALYQRHLHDSQIGIIEGNKGLYDGVNLDGSNSNAALARLLAVPVVLVINTKGMTRGIAPLLLGYQAFAEHIQIAGVILNMVGGPRHESKLVRVVEHYTDIQVLGAVQADPALNIDERHLGLIPSNEEDHAEQLIQKLATTVRNHIDLEALIDISATAKLPEKQSLNTVQSAEYQGIRIGYPKDRAFGFYYPDDFDRMRQLGAEPVAFNALQDTALPEVDGLFLGGGFPETAMHELEANHQLMAEVGNFIECGGPVYAECGGLIYLTQSLTWGEKKSRMVGIIQADTVMHEKPQGRGYVQLQDTVDNPWSSERQVSSERIINAHEFHYSALQGLDVENTHFAYKVVRGVGIDGTYDGIVYKNLLASYTHRRSVDANGWVDQFLEHVRSCKQ